MDDGPPVLTADPWPYRWNNLQIGAGPVTGALMLLGLLGLLGYRRRH